jgi:hypothetical protein
VSLRRAADTACRARLRAAETFFSPSEMTSRRRILDKAQSADAASLYIFAFELDRRAGRMSAWHPISTAPFDCDLQLSVIEKGEVYPLAFPCQRKPSGWVDAATGKLVRVDPTHWRDWLGPGGTA